jgi:5-methylthioadenosine/S-adenosylhomocysteine deaminase
MTVRYSADHVVPMHGSAVVHSPGIVDVDGDRITWCGPSDSAPASDAPVTVLRGALIPGLVNAHAHTPMVLLRGTGEGLPTDVWLQDVMWPREARLVADDVHHAMRLGAAELLTNGVTTTSEMYFYGDSIARGAVDAGLRCIVAAPLLEAPDFAHFGSIDTQLAAIADLRREWRDESLIEIVLGPHSAYAMSRAALEAVAGQAADSGMLIHIHVAEQPHEGDALVASTGRRVPAYLDELGLLTARTIGAHCIWMDDDELDLFAERGTTVAHCPASNGRHASGIARVTAMRARGIPVGLGTDGPASHDRLDLFEEMRTAIRYARVAGLDASLIDAPTALAMATSEAADALGRPDLGRLAAGARADMVLLDVEGPSYSPTLPDGDLIGRIVWAGTPQSVRAVWVGGRKVVSEGRCTTIDLVEAQREVNARAVRIAG